MRLRVKFKELVWHHGHYSLFMIILYLKTMPRLGMLVISSGHLGLDLHTLTHHRLPVAHISLNVSHPSIGLQHGMAYM